jgi:hypothetical protein
MRTRFYVAAMSAVLLVVAAEPTAQAKGESNIQRDFQGAAAEPDPAKRAEAVRPFLDAGDPALYCEAHDVLAKCGKAALPVLRDLVADESRADRYSFLATLVQAGGKDAVPELERLLADEKVYWNNLGMNLDDKHKIDRPRVEFLVEILTHLRKSGYADRRGLVEAVRDQFRDHPILGDHGKTGEVDQSASRSPVAVAADAIVLRK